MKKLLPFLALTVLAACGSGTSSSTITDSTVIKKDNTTTMVGPDTSRIVSDSTRKTTDSVHK